MRQFTRHVTLAVSLFIVGSGLTSTGRAQIVRDSVAELQGIDVVERLGEKIPLDVRLTDDRGRAVTMGDFVNGTQPVVLVMAYYECPMLCNLVLNGLTQAMKEQEWLPGEDYRVVTVSIKPSETWQLAAAKKNNYLQDLRIESADTGWVFLTGDSLESRRLADALGFKYFYVPEREEYAHPAVLHLISPDGTITRYLYGISFNRSDFKLALLEASEGKIGNSIDRLILYCFHYDPEAKGYVVFATNVMKLGGLLTLIVLGVVLVSLWLRERRRASGLVRQSAARGNV